MDKVCIVGAGLAGTLLSIYLSKRGYTVDIHEKRCLNSYNDDKKRSIAMSLSKRGISALKKAGLFDGIASFTTPTYGRATHDQDDAIILQNYHADHKNNALLTIERKRLINYLIQEAQNTGNVNFYFNSQLSSIDFDNSKVKVHYNNEQREIKYSYIVGADGVFSVVRACLEKHTMTSSAIKKLSLGYKEFHIPYSPDILARLKNDYVHVWSSKKAVFVALPSATERKFIANLYATTDGEEGFNSTEIFDAMPFFQKKFPHLVNIIPNLTALDKSNPINEMYMVNCHNWNYKNNIFLIGDACHAIAPFYAMGMNLAFESCALFDQLLEKNHGNLGKSFEEYQLYRKPDTDAMAKMSLENFKNLRTSSLLINKNHWELDNAIWKKFPDHWIPTYPLISFSNIPLRKVYLLHKQKKLILSKAIDKKNIIDNDGRIINYSSLMQYIENTFVNLQISGIEEHA